MPPLHKWLKRYSDVSGGLQMSGWNLPNGGVTLVRVSYQQAGLPCLVFVMPMQSGGLARSKSEEQL